MNKTIIGFLGRKGSGKSTCAKWCHRRYGSVNVPFAGNVKELARRILPDVPERFWFGTQEDKAEPLVVGWGDVSVPEADEYNGVCYTSGREIMQRLGNDARLILGERVWVDAVMMKIDQTNYSVYTIDDVRYHNEVERIKRVGGYVVKLYNESLPNDDEHPSESETDRIPAELIDLEIRHRDYGGVLESLDAWLQGRGLVPLPGDD